MGTDGCDLVPRAPIDKDWISFDEFVTVDEVATGLQVVLYANVGVRHELRTVTEYRDVSVERIDPVLKTTIFPPEVPEETVDLDRGRPHADPGGRPGRLGPASRSARWRTASTPGR